MTFILRAQNKSQGVNLESSSARIKTRHIFIGAILVCSFALTAGLLIFNESQITPADQQKTVVKNPQKTTKPDISKNSTEFNLELPNNHLCATRAMAMLTYEFLGWVSAFNFRDRRVGIPLPDHHGKLLLKTSKGPVDFSSMDQTSRFKM